MGNVKGRDKVWCLDAATGQTVWEYEYPCKEGSYPGPRCTPTAANGRVFTLSREGLLLCLDAAKGTVVWQSDLAKEVKVDGPTWGLASSPLVAGDLVFGGKTLAAAELATGKELWTHEWRTDWDVNAPDPVVLGDKVLVTTGYGRGCALLSVAEDCPAVVWENKNLSSQFGSLVLADDKLLILNEKGTLSVAAAVPDAYKELWSQKAMDGVCWTAPSLCNGLIYCRNEKGRLVCRDLKGN